MLPMRNYCLKKVKQSRFRANFSVHTRILVHVFRLKDKITYVKFLHITQIVSLLFVVHSDILESDDSSSNNLSPCARHSRIFNTWSNRKSCSSRGTRLVMHDENESQFFFLRYSIFRFRTQWKMFLVEWVLLRISIYFEHHCQRLVTIPIISKEEVCSQRVPFILHMIV